VTTELILFVLRVLSGLLLLSILAALFWVMWQGYRGTINQLQASRRSYGHLYLVEVIDGEHRETNQTYDLLPLTSLGRSPTNTIIIEDSFASSEHALLTLRNGQWWLEDRHSRNGTSLNGELISEPMVITNGDMIEVGNVCYRLELE
jgi:hypothetical protein